MAGPTFMDREGSVLSALARNCRISSSSSTSTNPTTHYHYLYTFHTHHPLISPEMTHDLPSWFLRQVSPSYCCRPRTALYDNAHHREDIREGMKGDEDRQRLRDNNSVYLYRTIQAFPGLLLRMMKRACINLLVRRHKPVVITS